MPPETVDGFTQLPTAEELGLENQLLALEVQVLRGRERVLAEQRARALSAPTHAVAPEGKVLISREDYEDLTEARRNLRWLIRRLGSGPLGWIVRSRSGYKNLASRWLDSPKQEVSGVAGAEPE